MHDGDLLVVDRAIKAMPGHVVVATHEGEFTVKRLTIEHNLYRLVPENPAYPIIECNESTEIWGVVHISLHWPSR